MLCKIRSILGVVVCATLFHLPITFASEPQEPSSSVDVKPLERQPLPAHLPDQADPQWVIPLPEFPGEEETTGDESLQGQDEPLQEEKEERLPSPPEEDDASPPAVPPVQEETAIPQKEAASPEIPLIYNDAVLQQIRFFQEVYREPLMKALARSTQYLPMIKEILRASNLPLDLAYLPLLESGFSVRAVSSAKAVGLWQFMRATAQQYGLRVDSWIDERRDPVKATRAAAAYLKDLYQRFGAWPLALASYNAGENRVLKAMAATQTVHFWELKATGKLPLQTQYFVPKYMAITMIAKDPAVYGFLTPEYEPPLQYDEVVITQRLSLDAVARAIGVPLKAIETLNPELRQGITPPHYPHYRLKLPRNTKEIFAARPIKPTKTHLHRIRRGETLGVIAKHYNIPMKTLLRANRLNTRSVIRAGRFLIIPNV